MLFIDSRNSKKMAAVYTAHSSSIRIFICLYFPNMTLKTYKKCGRSLFRRHKLMVYTTIQSDHKLTIYMVILWSDVGWASIKLVPHVFFSKGCDWRPRELHSYQIKCNFKIYIQNSPKGENKP